MRVSVGSITRGCSIGIDTCARRMLDDTGPEAPGRGTTSETVSQDEVFVSLGELQRVDGLSHATFVAQYEGTDVQVDVELTRDGFVFVRVSNLLLEIGCAIAKLSVPLPDSTEVE